MGAIVVFDDTTGDEDAVDDLADDPVPKPKKSHPGPVATGDVTSVVG